MMLRSNNRQIPKNILIRFNSSIVNNTVNVNSSIKTPPKEAKHKKSINNPNEEINLPKFDVKDWASKQPNQLSSLFALRGRLSLASIPIEEFEKCCAHKSFRNVNDNTNEIYEMIGNTFLGQVATEHLHLTYPNLPLQVLKASVSALVGPKSCASIAREWGAQSVLRWQRNDGQKLYLHEDAMASISKSIIGLVLKYKGIGSALEFAKTFFISRKLDISSMLKFDNPVVIISHTAKKFGFDDGVEYKLLSESGRYSISPIFVIGVFTKSNNLKLGEGFGSSLAMAKHRVSVFIRYCVFFTNFFVNSKF